MSTTIKKTLSVIFFLFLSFLQIGVFLPLRPAVADTSLIDSQEGFKGKEIQAAFGNDTPDDIRITMVRIIMIVLSVLGVIFLSLLLFAGFKYMTAAGNEDKVKEAVKQITQAVIGLVIILSAWGISYFILLRIRAAITGTNYLYF
ncbi:MAG: hypothetical protein PHG95_03180 [Patescibacteria group bacterium]|nr:hypothetical protein [Patescibacteria group bacterium]